MSDPGHVWTLDEILGQVAKQPVMFQPGERWGYSNTNYILLGEILASVTGRSWRDVVRDQVIARARLEHTTLPDVGDMECPACAHGYVSVGDELRDLTRVDPSMAGASGGHALITTSADLTRFLQSLRNGALFDHPDTLSAMFAFQPALDPQTRTVGYGLGVMRMESNGNIAIGNLGGTAGYQSFMLYVPATDRYLTGFINVMGDLGAVLEPVLARVATP
jgi:D-alanyl-D-alanine carboxypeptidase